MKRRRGRDKYGSSPYFILDGTSLPTRSNTIISVTAGSKDATNRKNEGNRTERIIFDIASLDRRHLHVRTSFRCHNRTCCLIAFPSKDSMEHNSTTLCPLSHSRYNSLASYRKEDMPEGKVSMLEGLKKVSRNKFLWLVSVANLTLLVTYFGATKYFPSQEQLKEYLGSSAPFLIALISVALIFGLLLLPTLSLRIGEKKALILYQILVALLLPVFAEATIARSNVIWLLSPLIGVLLGGIIPLYFSFLSKTGVERKYFGIASGIFVSVLNIGGFLAPILSEIMDSMGGIYAVTLLFSLSSIAGALFSYLFPTGKEGEEKS